MPSSKLQPKTAAKPSSKTPSSSATKRATTKLVRSKPVARAAARKAVVLGQVQGAKGKLYQVLTPVAEPRHLTTEDVQQAVELMVSAR